MFDEFAHDYNDYKLYAGMDGIEYFYCQLDVDDDLLTGAVLFNKRMIATEVRKILFDSFDHDERFTKLWRFGSAFDVASFIKALPRVEDIHKYNYNYDLLDLLTDEC